MSTLTVTGVPASRRSTGKRIVLWLLVILALLAAGAIAVAYFVVHAALPQLDGSVDVKGLSAPVKVTRDAHGVPAIEAATLEDLFLAQGYVTAQDRLWQMDIMRRFASGELSEILGEDTLKIDREQRILGLRAAAGKSLQMASASDRSYLEAYARGVNAFIESHGSGLPIEFRILKYRPKQWQAEDSIVIAKPDGAEPEFLQLRGHLRARENSGQAGTGVDGRFICNRSWHDRPPTVMRESINDQENQGDSDDEDDDDDGPDNSVTQRSDAIEGDLGAGSSGSSEWIERLGRLRNAHGDGQAAAIE